MLNRRKFLKQLALVTGGFVLFGKIFSGTRKKVIKYSEPRFSNKFTIPSLPFPYSYLEPYIDSKTMQIHYQNHHYAYVNSLNSSISGTSFDKLSLDQMFKVADSLPLEIRNNAGGHWNHSFLWQILGLNSGIPEVKTLRLIKNRFISFENFKLEFSKTSKDFFGSGWIWVVFNGNEISITTTSNQDNPLMNDLKIDGYPILCLDLWEHAYYLKYKNKRSDYIDAFWKVIDWKKVEMNVNNFST